MGTTLSAIRTYCDQITDDGSELSVKWDGGNDSGFFELCLDDKEIPSGEGIACDLLTLIEEHLGYGSFAGDFSTEGRLIYNRETKCFEGQDIYGETEDTFRDCKLPIVIPSHIWFDRILVELDYQEGHAGNTVSLTLLVNNGPVLPVHKEWERRYEIELDRLFRQEVEQIEDLTGVWDTVELDTGNFSPHGTQLLCNLTRFTYSKWYSDCLYKSIPLI